MRARGWLVPAIIALVIGGWAWREEMGRGAHAGAERATAARRMPAPRKSDRVLIIAPHCDDELVGCGGLIQEAEAAGAGVRVVIITNGDAFRVAAERLYHTTAVTPEQYLRMGRQRQEESRAALAVLGVSAKQVVFLGYPDGGTAAMWRDRWESPYTSVRTQTDRSPYADSLRREAPYRGRTLLDDLKAVMSEFHPTVVALPHAADRHSDHWAAWCYGTAALYELGLWGKVRSPSYLIHEQGGAEADPRAPPREPEAWESLALGAPQQDLKRKAISCYRTQLPLLGRLMLGSATPEEWYAEARPQELPRVVQSERVKWESVPPALSDSPEPQRVTPPSADITSVRVCRTAHDLHVLIELRAAASSEISYGLHLHALGRDRVLGPTNYLVTPGKESGGITAKATARGIEVAIPWSAGDLGVMFSADTHGEGRTRDRTRWVMLTAR